MIVARRGTAWRVITQPDHARFAAALLGLWRLPGLADHPRRRGLLRAIREHDNGWQEPDAAPRVETTSGQPVDFLNVPEEQRLQIWRRGTARPEDPYVALLIVEHALALHRDGRDDSGWQELLAQLEERKEELLTRCGLGEAELAADYRWLAIADRLSLLVCADWESADVGGWQAVARPGVAGTELLLSPFPLAGSTRLGVPCRTIERRRFASDGDLAVALASARWEELTVRVAEKGA